MQLDEPHAYWETDSVMKNSLTTRRRSFKDSLIKGGYKTQNQGSMCMPHEGGGGSKKFPNVIGQKYLRESASQRHFQKIGTHRLMGHEFLESQATDRSSQVKRLHHISSQGLISKNNPFDMQRQNWPLEHPNESEINTNAQTFTNFVDPQIINKHKIGTKGSQLHQSWSVKVFPKSESLAKRAMTFKNKNLQQRYAFDFHEQDTYTQQQRQNYLQHQAALGRLESDELPGLEMMDNEQLPCNVSNSRRLNELHIDGENDPQLHVPHEFGSEEQIQLSKDLSEQQLSQQINEKLQSISGPESSNRVETRLPKLQTQIISRDHFKHDGLSNHTINSERLIKDIQFLKLNEKNISNKKAEQKKRNSRKVQQNDSRSSSCPSSVARKNEKQKLKYQIITTAGNPKIKGNNNAYSPPFGKNKYVYQVQNEELPEGIITLSHGNKYHEGSNPNILKFINAIQGRIRISYDIKNEMVDNSHKIFDMMKKEKSAYMQTLLKGEDDGHCFGIKQRSDPQQKYRMVQQMAKQLSQQKELIQQIKQQKKLKDQQKINEKRDRIAERMKKINEKSSSHGNLVNSFFGSGRMQSYGNSPIGQSKQQLFEHQDFQTTFNMRKMADFESPGSSSSAGSCNVNEQDIDRELERLDINRLAIRGYEMTHLRSNITKQLQKKMSYTKKMQKNQRLKEEIGLLQLKNITQVQQKALEQLRKTNQASNLSKIILFLQQNSELTERQPASGAIDQNPQRKAQVIFSSHKQLGLNDHPAVINWFKMLSEEPDMPIKHTRLKRAAFKAFLAERYSNLFGERILQFLESHFTALYRIDFQGFLTIIMDLLNGGQEVYKKLVFTCFGISNAGRICEHDVFAMFEQFKQKESFFFYKELIYRKDVPRDYKTIVDDSDYIFFKAFAPDINRVSQIITLKKRVFGFEDADTLQGIEADFDPEMYESNEQFEAELCTQIAYLLEKVVKRQNNVIHQEIADLFIKDQSLQTLRNRLCELVARHTSQNSRSNPNKAKGAMQNSQNEQDMQSNNELGQSNNVIKLQSTQNPCLGNAVSQTGRRIGECIYISFEDFQKLMDFGKPNLLSSLAIDLVKAITADVIDLAKFEKEYGQYRDASAPKFEGTLHHIVVKQGEPPVQQKLHASSTTKSVKQVTQSRKGTSALTAERTTDMAQESQLTNNVAEEPSVFRQNHKITDPYIINDSVFDAGFKGKILRKQKLDLDPGSRKPGKGQVDADGAESRAGKVILLNQEQIRELFVAKKFLGIANFLNIFRAFYLLSEIPKDAQNNPFGIYMTQKSCLRGFKAAFGIDIEEVAIRFYQLFVSEGEGKQRIYNIDLIQWLNIMKKICGSDKRGHEELGFRFYDYDRNGQVGSVDIVNFLKFLPYDKIKKIERKYNEIYDQKRILAQAKKAGNLRQVKKSLVIIPFDADISDSDNERPQHSDNNSASCDSESSDENAVTLDLKRMRKNLTSKIKEVEHLKSRKINNYWNQVLFEAKLLRNFYVDQTVIPKITNTIQVHLNMKVFSTKFVPVIRDKYSTENTSKGFNSPAIIQFFRSNLVAIESEVHGFYKQQNGPKTLMRSDSTTSAAALTAPQLDVTADEKLPETQLVSKFAAKIERDSAPITEEMKVMMVALMELSKVPPIAFFNNIPDWAHEWEGKLAAPSYQLASQSQLKVLDPPLAKVKPGSVRRSVQRQGAAGPKHLQKK